MNDVCEVCGEECASTVECLTCHQAVGACCLEFGMCPICLKWGEDYYPKTETENSAPERTDER